MEMPMSVAKLGSLPRKAPHPRCEPLEPRTMLALVPSGGPLQVNSASSVTPRNPVAVNASGDFVVVWGTRLPLPPGPSYGIYGRRYNAAGEPLGDEFPIAT